MKILIFLIFLFPAFLFAATPEYSATQHERHQAMQEHFEEWSQRPWWEWKYMTGNWGGMRNFLAERGVTATSKYVINAAGNPIGGKRRGIAEASSWGSDINYDLGKRTPLKGWHLYVSWAFRFGTSLSNRKILNQFNVQQVFGAQTIKLISLYLQKFAFDKKLMFKFGRLSTGDDFNASPFYYYFMNNGFDGNPIVPNFNLPFTAYPAATWGFYLKVKPVPFIQGKFGIYNNNRGIRKNRHHGLFFSFKHPEGGLIFGELGYLYDQVDPCGLPGNYLIGAGYSTRRKLFFLSGKKSSGNYELYIQCDQMVMRTTDKSGITPFFTFLYSPDNRNLFPYFFMTGVVAEGIIPSRPDDSINFGVNWGQYSADLREKERREGTPQQHSETDFELNYKAQLSEFFFIQPNIQYIIWPSGIKSISNAFVIGIQSGVSF